MDIQVIIKALPEMVAQLLGFLIVFFVLKKFAFRPVLAVIDARRKKIEDEFQGIENQKKKLENLEKDYRARFENIEEIGRVKIQEAANVGVQLAKDIQEKARQDAQKLLERAHAEIAQDITKARLSMRDEIVELSGLITEKVIRERLDEKEHAKLVEKFIKDLDTVG